MHANSSLKEEEEEEEEEEGRSGYFIGQVFHHPTQGFSHNPRLCLMRSRIYQNQRAPKLDHTTQILDPCQRQGKARQGKAKKKSLSCLPL